MVAILRELSSLLLHLIYSKSAPDSSRLCSAIATFINDELIAPPQEKKRRLQFSSEAPESENATVQQPLLTHRFDGPASSFAVRK